MNNLELGFCSHHWKNLNISTVGFTGTVYNACYFFPLRLYYYWTLPNNFIIEDWASLFECYVSLVTFKINRYCYTPLLFLEENIQKFRPALQSRLFAGAAAIFHKLTPDCWRRVWICCELPQSSVRWSSF